MQNIGRKNTYEHKAYEHTVLKARGTLFLIHPALHPKLKITSSNPPKPVDESSQSNMDEQGQVGR